MGKPQRAIVAAGYRAVASGLITINEDGSVTVNV
jgi:hypothetical protein